MLGSLQSLCGFEPRRPSVRLWNALIAEVEARTLRFAGDFGAGRDPNFSHPWKVVAGRWEDMPEGLACPRGRVWRMSPTRMSQKRSHCFGAVKDYCDDLGRPFVRLPRGYNPNQVAREIAIQLPEMKGP